MAAFAKAGLAALALLLVACSAPDGPVSIQTRPDAGGVCLLLPRPGVLVANPTWGLALAGTDESGSAHLFGVIWPHGYSARREQGTAMLIDAAGQVVAREGDKVMLDAGPQDPLRPCGDIYSVLDAP